MDKCYNTLKWISNTVGKQWWLCFAMPNREREWEISTRCIKYPHNETFQPPKVPRTDWGEGWLENRPMNIVLRIGRELQDPWSLTGCHAELHTWLRCFCTARALSVCRRLPVGEQRSLSPGNQPGWQSDFLSGAEHPVTSWRPRCSFCAGPSICRPAQIMQKKRKGGEETGAPSYTMSRLFQAF